MASLESKFYRRAHILVLYYRGPHATCKLTLAKTYKVQFIHIKHTLDSIIILKLIMKIRAKKSPSMLTRVQIKSCPHPSHFRQIWSHFSPKIRKPYPMGKETQAGFSVRRNNLKRKPTKQVLGSWFIVSVHSVQKHMARAHWEVSGIYVDKQDLITFQLKFQICGATV